MTSDARTRQQLPEPAADTRPPLARGANWAVALVAAVLLAASLGAYLYHRGQLADIAAEHLRLVLTGPARLHTHAAAEYNVTTTAVTGTPVPAQVEFTLDAPDGQRLWGHQEKADERGHLRVTIPAGLQVPDHARLEVLAVYRDKLQRIDTRLAVQPARYVTRATVDRSLYQPGETVYYRSLTLSRFGLAAEREVPIHFEILDTNGDVVPESQSEGLSDHGVGNGVFRLADDLPGGRYTLLARSLDRSFPDEKRTFFVRRYQLPRLKKQLTFIVPQKNSAAGPTDGSTEGKETPSTQGGAVVPSTGSRESYTAGDKVTARFVAQHTASGPAAGVQLRILATLDGEKIFEQAAQTDDAGAAQIEFSLPEKIDRGDGELVAVADDGGAQETLSKRIPINLGKVEVTFYPEGGDLVADLENRVYFAARSPRGAPVSIKGFLVDGSGADVAVVETAHNGMGSFSFTPLPAERYSLRITNPAGMKDQPNLPQVSTDQKQKVVLTTGTGVFGAGEPLEFNIRALQADLPLLVAASCRGVPVGQQTLITTLKHNGANPVAIPLSEQVGGVIRLTVYDYGAAPPRPVAERLVYRRMPRWLSVRAAAADRSYSPGEKVEVLLRTSNEKGQPVPAALGAAVVDDALLNLAGDRTSALSADFLLTSEIERPEDLERADFYLSDSSPARAALDLLLGTQGWRRFVEKTLRELQREGSQSGPIARLVATDAEPGPPVMFDNLREIRDNYKQSLAAYRADRTRALNTLTTVSFFGGLGLVLLVAMLGVLKIVSGIHLWLSAVGTTICCVIIGTILMDPDRLRSSPDLAVAFAPFHPAQQGPGGATAGVKHSAGDASAENQKQAAKEESKTAPPGAPREETQGARRPAGAVAQPAPAAPAAQPAAALDAAGAAAMPQAEEAAERAVAQRAVEEQQRAAKQPKPPAKKVRPTGPQGPPVAAGHPPAKPAEKSAKAAELDRFTVRQYAHQHLAGPPGVRSDFAETLFWHPLLLAGADGRAGISFELSDSVGTFRVLVDAHADGRIGSGGCKVISRLPLSLDARVPLEATAGDRIELPVTVVNDTQTQLPVELRLRHGELIQLDGPPRRKLDLSPAERRREYFVLDVVGEQGACELTVHAAAGQLADAVRRLLYVVPPGFATHISRSGQLEGRKELAVELPEFCIPGSLEVLLRVFSSGPPDTPGRPQTMLDEPHGYFDPAATPDHPTVIPANYVEAYGAAMVPRQGHVVRERNGWADGQPQPPNPRDPPLLGTRNRKSIAAGKLILQRDGRMIGEYPFGPGRQETISIDNLEASVQPGENQLTLLLTGEAKMAYALDVSCSARKPLSDQNCPLRLSTQLASEQVQVGEPVALTAELVNPTDQDQPGAVAVLGLPAGLEPRPDQLEELNRTGTIDCYEIRPREVLCSWRRLPPKHQVQVKLDLVATVPGRFTGPASRTYLSANPEQKQWTDPVEVEVTRE
jgi:hypothetical protein